MSDAEGKVLIFSHEEDMCVQRLKDIQRESSERLMQIKHEIEKAMIYKAALTEISKKKKMCIASYSEEYREGSAEAFDQCADIAIEALRS